MTKSSRRSLLGGLAASIFAPLAGLFGGRVRAEQTKELVIPIRLDPAQMEAIKQKLASLKVPNIIEERIRAEKDRLNECILDPTISAERRSQYYAAQQALAWAIDPGGFMDPSQAINEDLCRWLAWPGMEQPVYRGVEAGPGHPVEISSVPS